jgi:hydroxypyruvate isomerase
VRFDVNVGILFTELPLLERFGAVAATGFRAAECWWPEPGTDLDDLVRAVGDAELDLTLLNFFGGDLPAGDRGVAADPARHEEFRANVPVALGLAERLGCTTLHALVGKHLPGHDRDDQLALAAENVRWAADLAAHQGATIVVEPLNPIDNGPCLIQRIDDAHAFIDRVGRDNVGVQFDTYHLSRTEPDLAAAVARAAGSIRHVQVADDPGRGHPGSGAIDFASVFAALEAAGYDGGVGLEYAAQGPGADLDWLPRDLRSGDVAADRVGALFGG